MIKRFLTLPLVFAGLMLMAPGCDNGTTPPEPVLKLTFPVGGEIWHPNDSVTITWDEQSSKISSVDVYISVNDQMTWGNGVRDNASLCGSTSVPAGRKCLGWKIPSNVITSTTCYVRIWEYGTELYPSTNATAFTITP